MIRETIVAGALALALSLSVGVTSYAKDTVPAPVCTPDWHMMVHTQDGRDTILMQLGELRMALMQMMLPPPAAVQREVILHEAKQLEDLVKQYKGSKRPMEKRK